MVEQSSLVGTLLRYLVLAVALVAAYNIRLNAVHTYGRVIHEFDPWFNFRATQYLVDNGWAKFRDWFDEMSWWPIGRHVGSTIYPGLMVTSAVVHKAMNTIGIEISVNDVCVFLPAVFACITCIFTYLLTKEVSGSANSGVAAAFLMAILPAHIMRSVAGSYDNEAVAMTAMVSTFYFWVRSIRDKDSWPIGVVTGFAYIYMVSTWGAYPFVLNMIGLHAGFLIVIGRFTSHLHYAYTLFFVIGTAGALQFPLVGSLPYQSLEQLMPLGVFLLLQVVSYIETYRSKLDNYAFEKKRREIFGLAVLAAAVLFGFLLTTGRLGAFSTRVKSLFIPHTRTGNPLVDSVAEHQATPPTFYHHYFHLLYYIAPFGLIALLFDRTDTKYFGIIYTIVSYYFSQKMVRLVLLLSPAASIVGGVALWVSVSWAFNKLFGDDSVTESSTESSSESDKKDASSTPSKPGKQEKPKQKAKQQQTKNPFDFVSDPKLQPVFKVLAAALLIFVVFALYQYSIHCIELSRHLSEPHLMMRGRNKDGQEVIIDDFREAYWWLRDNTPADSRVMAWWDYGYQINGIANRTTIADGNTWNHEHIALLGKCLVSKEEESWLMTRHLADYVLVWTTRFAGIYGDDIAKMPHMANIAGSVYSDVNRVGYYMDQHGNPSALMKESLLYKLTFYNMGNNGVTLKHFDNVFNSRNYMVRIYKVKDVAKRHPFGTYAPELKIGQFKQ